MEPKEVERLRATGLGRKMGPGGWLWQGELWEGVAEGGDSPQAAHGKCKGKVGLEAKAGRGKAVALRKVFQKN